MQTQPQIKVSKTDYDRLSGLLDRIPETDAVTRLIDELERAEILETDQMPEKIVAMNTTVTFSILSAQKSFTYTLVYPHDVTGKDKLSILTPVGSALLGLSVGQEIEWPLENGKRTQVRINAILTF